MYIRNAENALQSGVYSLQELGGATVDRYCDMETQGGGWTLMFKVQQGYGLSVNRTDPASIEANLLPLPNLFEQYFNRSTGKTWIEGTDVAPISPLHNYTTWNADIIPNYYNLSNYTLYNTTANITVNATTNATGLVNVTAWNNNTWIFTNYTNTTSPPPYWSLMSVNWAEYLEPSKVYSLRQTCSKYENQTDKFDLMWSFTYPGFTNQPNNTVNATESEMAWRLYNHTVLHDDLTAKYGITWDAASADRLFWPPFHFRSNASTEFGQVYCGGVLTNYGDCVTNTTFYRRLGNAGVGSNAGTKLGATYLPSAMGPDVASIDGLKHIYGESDEPMVCSYYMREEAPTDCDAIQTLNPAAVSGNYLIQPTGSPYPIEAYCDFTTIGGGWLLMSKFQQATNTSDVPQATYDAYFGGSTIWIQGNSEKTPTTPAPENNVTFAVQSQNWEHFLTRDSAYQLRQTCSKGPSANQDPIDFMYDFVYNGHIVQPDGGRQVEAGWRLYNRVALQDINGIIWNYTDGVSQEYFSLPFTASHTGNKLSACNGLSFEATGCSAATAAKRRYGSAGIVTADPTAFVGSPGGASWLPNMNIELGDDPFDIAAFAQGIFQPQTCVQVVDTCGNVTNCVNVTNTYNITCQTGCLNTTGFPCTFGVDANCTNCNTTVCGTTSNITTNCTTSLVCSYKQQCTNSTQAPPYSSYGRTNDMMTCSYYLRKHPRTGLPTSCQEILDTRQGNATDGSYLIQISPTKEPVEVYCEFNVSTIGNDTTYVPGQKAWSMLTKFSSKGSVFRFTVRDEAWWDKYFHYNAFTTGNSERKPTYIAPDYDDFHIESHNWADFMQKGKMYQIRVRVFKDDEATKRDEIHYTDIFQYPGFVTQQPGPSMSQKVFWTVNRTIETAVAGSENALERFDINYPTFFAMPDFRFSDNYNAKDPSLDICEQSSRISFGDRNDENLFSGGAGDNTRKRWGCTGSGFRSGIIFPYSSDTNTRDGIVLILNGGSRAIYGESDDDMVGYYYIREVDIDVNELPKDCMEQHLRDPTLDTNLFYLNINGNIEPVFCEMKDATQGSGWLLLAKFSQDGKFIGEQNMEDKILRYINSNSSITEGGLNNPPMSILRARGFRDKSDAHAESHDWRKFLIEGNDYELRHKCGDQGTPGDWYDVRYDFNYPGFVTQKSGLETTVFDKAWIVSGRKDFSTQYYAAFNDDDLEPGEVGLFYLPWVNNNMTPAERNGILCHEDGVGPTLDMTGTQCIRTCDRYNSMGFMRWGGKNTSLTSVGFNTVIDFERCPENDLDFCQLENDARFGDARGRMTCTLSVRPRQSAFPKTCTEAGGSSGMKRLQSPTDPKSSQLVYCDQDTDGGGWVLAAKFSQPGRSNMSDPSTINRWDPYLYNDTMKFEPWTESGGLEPPLSPEPEETDYTVQSLYWEDLLSKDGIYELRQTCSKFGNNTDLFDHAWVFIYNGFHSQASSEKIQHKGWKLTNRRDLLQVAYLAALNITVANATANISATNTSYTDPLGIDYDIPDGELVRFVLPYAQTTSGRLLQSCNGYAFDANPTLCGERQYGQAGIIGDEADNKDPGFTFPYNFGYGVDDIAYIRQAPHIYGQSGHPMTCSYYIRELPQRLYNFTKSCDDMTLNPGFDVKTNATKVWPSGIYMVQRDENSRPQQVYCDMDTEGGGWTHLAKFTQPSSVDNLSDEIYKSYFVNGKWINGVSDGSPDTVTADYGDFMIESVEWESIIGKANSSYGQRYEMRQKCGKGAALNVDNFDMIIEMAYPGFMAQIGTTVIPSNCTGPNGTCYDTAVVPETNLDKKGWDLDFGWLLADPSGVLSGRPSSGRFWLPYGNTDAGDPVVCGDQFDVAGGLCDSAVERTLGNAGFGAVGPGGFDPAMAWLPFTANATGSDIGSLRGSAAYGNTGAQMSCSYYIRDLQPPPVTEAATQVGTVGGWITITGQNFGHNPRPVSVVIDDSNIPCSSPTWLSDTALKCIVPARYGRHYTVSVRVGSQLSQPVHAFSYQAPTIYGWSPKDYAAGSAMTITGANFGTAAAGLAITIDSVACTGTTYLDQNHIICTVPAGITQGTTLFVGVDNGNTTVKARANNAANPTFTDFNPAALKPVLNTPALVGSLQMLPDCSNLYFTNDNELLAITRMPYAFDPYYPCGNETAEFFVTMPSLTAQLSNCFQVIVGDEPTNVPSDEPGAVFFHHEYMEYAHGNVSMIPGVTFDAAAVNHTFKLDRTRALEGSWSLMSDVPTPLETNVTHVNYTLNFQNDSISIPYTLGAGSQSCIFAVHMWDDSEPLWYWNETVPLHPFANDTVFEVWVSPSQTGYPRIGVWQERPDVYSYATSHGEWIPTSRPRQKGWRRFRLLRDQAASSTILEIDGFPIATLSYLTFAPEALTFAHMTNVGGKVWFDSIYFAPYSPGVTTQDNCLADTCHSLKKATPGLASGVETVRYPFALASSSGYCEQDSDDGGWLLVADFYTSPGFWTTRPNATFTAAFYAADDTKNWIKDGFGVGGSQDIPLTMANTGGFRLKGRKWTESLKEGLDYDLRQVCNIGSNPVQEDGIDVMFSFKYNGRTSQANTTNFFDKVWILGNYTVLGNYSVAVDAGGLGANLTMLFYLPTVDNGQPNVLGCGDGGYTHDFFACGHMYNRLPGAAGITGNYGLNFLPNVIQPWSAPLDPAMLNELEGSPTTPGFGYTGQRMGCQYLIRPRLHPLYESCEHIQNAFLGPDGNTTAKNGQFLIRRPGEIESEVVYCDFTTGGRADKKGEWILLSQFIRPNLTDMPAQMYNDYFVNNLWIEGVAEGPPLNPRPVYDGFHVYSLDWRNWLEKDNVYELRQQCFEDFNEDLGQDNTFTFVYPGFVKQGDGDVIDDKSWVLGDLVRLDNRQQDNEYFNQSMITDAAWRFWLPFTPQTNGELLCGTNYSRSLCTARSRPYGNAGIVYEKLYEAPHDDRNIGFAFAPSAAVGLDLANVVQSPPGTNIFKSSNIQQTCNYYVRKADTTGVPTSCSEIQKRNPQATTGVYFLKPTNGTVNTMSPAYCDMDTEDGGWTLMSKFVQNSTAGLWGGVLRDNGHWILGNSQAPPTRPEGNTNTKYTVESLNWEAHLVKDRPYRMRQTCEQIDPGDPTNTTNAIDIMAVFIYPGFVTQQPGTSIRKKGWVLANLTQIVDNTPIRWDFDNAEIFMFWLPWINSTTNGKYLCGKGGYLFDDSVCDGEDVQFNSGIIGGTGDREDPALAFLPNSLSLTLDLALVHQGDIKLPPINATLAAMANYTAPPVPPNPGDYFHYGNTGLPMTCSYYIQDLKAPVYDNCDVYLQEDVTIPSGHYVVQPVQSSGIEVVPSIVYCEMDSNVDGGGWMLLSKFTQNESLANIPPQMVTDYLTSNLWINGHAEDYPLTPIPEYDGFHVESWDWGVYFQNQSSYQIRQHCMKGNFTEEWDVIFGLDFGGYTLPTRYGGTGGTLSRSELGLLTIDGKASLTSANVPISFSSEVNYFYFPRSTLSPTPSPGEWVMSGCAGGRWSNSSDATQFQCSELLTNGNSSTWFNYTEPFGSAGLIGLGEFPHDQTSNEDGTSPGAALLPNLIPGTSDWSFVPQARYEYGIMPANDTQRHLSCYYWGRINKAPPKVLSITNSTTAGSTIVITGANFGATTRPVLVDIVFYNTSAKIPCSNAQWLSSVRIRCDAPPGISTGHSLVVEVDGRNNTDNNLFSYFQPTIFTVSRPPTAGGTVTIRGTNFGEVTSPVEASIDNQPCGTPLWVSNSMIECVIGPGSGGSMNTEVIVGGSWSDPNNLFSYEDPLVTSISTAETVRETLITLRGNNFGETDNPVDVTILVPPAYYQCRDPTWISPNEIQCRAPPKLPVFGTTPLADLNVRVNIDGLLAMYPLLDYRGTVDMALSQNPAVGLILDPAHEDKKMLEFTVSNDDTTPVSVLMTVKSNPPPNLNIFGSNVADKPSFAIVKDSSVTPPTYSGTLKYKPSANNGTVHYTIQTFYTTYGKLYSTNTTLSLDFAIQVNVFPPPLITSVNPDFGSSCGPQTVTIGGKYFGAYFGNPKNFTTARLSNLPCKLTSTLYLSSERLECITESSEEVRLLDGPAIVQSTDGITAGAHFSIIDAQVFNVTPSFGPTKRPTEVELTGKFMGNSSAEVSSITLADVPCVNMTYFSHSKIRCWTSPSPGPQIGVAQVKTRASSCLAATTNYEFISAEITKVTPTWSLTTGGSTITIEGRYFGDGLKNNVTDVYFAATKCESFVHYSDSLIHCVSNASYPHNDVSSVVTTWGGAGQSKERHFYYYSLFETERTEPFPELKSAQPAFGPTTGDTIITLRGKFLGINNTDIDKIFIGADKVPCWTDHATLWNTPWDVQQPVTNSSSNTTFRLMQSSDSVSYPLNPRDYNGTDIFLPNAWWFNNTMIRCITYAGRGGVYRDYPKVQKNSPVVVSTHSGGTGLRSEALFTFEYANPRISGISPKVVPFVGNVNITIHGDFFGWKPDPYEPENQQLVVLMGGSHCLHSYYQSETTAICTVHSYEAMEVPAPYKFQVRDHRYRTSALKDLGLKYVGEEVLCNPKCGVHANCINRQCVCNHNYGNPPDCAIRAVTAMPTEFLKMVRYYSDLPVLGKVSRPEAQLKKFDPSNYQPSDFPPYVISESGDRSVNISVWLNLEPAVPVTVVPYSNDTTECQPDVELVFREGEKQCQGEHKTFSDTLTTQSCVKTFTITGREDTLRDGDVFIEIRFVVKSKNPHFNGMWVPPVILKVLESNPVVRKLSPGMAPTFGANLTLAARNMDPQFTVLIGDQRARFWYSWDIASQNMSFDGLSLGREFREGADPPPPLVTKNRQVTRRSSLSTLQVNVPNATGPVDNTSIVEGSVIVVVETPSVTFPGYLPLVLENEGGSMMKVSDLLFLSNDCPTEGYWGTGKDCRLCPIGGICPGGKRLRPQAGYWNYDEGDPWVYKCIPAERCAGCENTTLASQCYVPDPHTGSIYAPCGDIYMDEYCAHCIEGYEEMHGVCVECPSYEKFVLLLVGVILLWVAVAVSGWLITSHETFSHFILVILACQEIGGVSQMLLADMSLAVRRAYGFFALFNGQLSFLSPDCFHGRFDYEADFGWAVLFNAVLGVPLLVGIPIIKHISMYKHRNDELEIADNARNFYNDRFVRACTCVVSLLYFPLTQKCVETLSCLPVNGEWRLATDVSHVCYSWQHMTAYGAALILLITLTIGWPTLYFLWIRRNTLFLYSDQSFMNRFDFLYGQFLAKYRSGWMAEFFIRASIAAGATVLRNYNLLQYAVVGGAFFFNLMIIIFLMPYRRRWTNFVRIGLALGNFLAVTVILMVRLEKVESSSSQGVGLALLGIAGFSLLVLVFAGFFWTIKGANEININVLNDQQEKARIEREKQEEEELDTLLDDVFVMPKMKADEVTAQEDVDLDILDTVARPFVAAAEYVGEANIPDPLIALGLEEYQEPTYYYETRPDAVRPVGGGDSVSLEDPGPMPALSLDSMSIDETVDNRTL